MGYYKVGHIEHFMPDNDKNTLYILSESSMSFSELKDQIMQYFGLVCDDDLDAISIRSEKIHTRCIGYDRYDGGDYDDYIIAERMTA